MVMATTAADGALQFRAVVLSGIPSLPLQVKEKVKRNMRNQTFCSVKVVDMRTKGK